ncbi:MAG TPA: aspartate aminotransferase family protein [Conexibacter sp.]|nr:aspartate aminotransferase family protein [Conexibacter sp.]
MRPTDQQLQSLIDAEVTRFREENPGSWACFQEARGPLLEGVPMPWMTEWASPYPLFVERAEGAAFWNVDGREYVDFCLGDTGAMAGHAAAPVARAVAAQAAAGITMMLPTADAAAVGEELTRRFGVSHWQFSLTATDANRFVMRLARRITGRPKVLVFNWCYHGSADETLAVLDGDAVVERPQSIGPPVDPALTTKVVEWNDVAALERALADEDVACVLAEPALTNIGIVPPDPGFHDALRELTRRHGTLLVIDETHTICCGPGGYTGAHGLKPDAVTIGKTIAGGVPAAAYGMGAEMVERMGELSFLRGSDVGGVGGTLAGNALSLAAIRTTLDEVLTDEAFVGMTALAERFEAGVADVIAAHDAPWHVTRLGCRAEYWFCRERPRNGGEAAAAVDPLLDRYFHLYLLNRGILMTPFHNMALMCPATTAAQVDRHTEVFAEAVERLASEAGR